MFRKCNIPCSVRCFRSCVIFDLVLYIGWKMKPGADCVPVLQHVTWTSTRSARRACRASAAATTPSGAAGCTSTSAARPTSSPSQVTTRAANEHSQSFTVPALTCTPLQWSRRVTWSRWTRMVWVIPTSRSSSSLTPGTARRRWRQGR